MQHMIKKSGIVLILLILTTSVNAQSRVADSLMEIGDYSAAIVQLQELPQNPDVLFKLGRAYSSTGNTTKAIQSITDGLLEDSTAVRPRFELARLYLSTNDPVKSFTMFNQLVADYPANATYKFYKGQLLELFKQEEEAIVVYKKALSLDPEYRSARMELIALLIKSRQYTPAIEAAKFVLRQNPDDIKFNSLIAQAYFNAMDYGKSITHLNHLLEDLNNDTEYNRRTLAVSYLLDGQWQLAVDNLDIFLKQYNDKDPAIYFMKSKAHLKLEQYTEAQDAIEYTILYKRPAIAEEYLQMAAIAAAQDDFRATFEAMKLAYAENSEDQAIAYQYTVAADRYFKDKKLILGYYERYLNKFGNTSGYGEYAGARVSDLKKEIFMSVGN